MVQSIKINSILRLRLYRLLLGWGSAGLAYHIGRRYTASPIIIPENALDAVIAFNPNAVWVYLSFFILIPYAYLNCQAKRLLPLQLAMQFAAVVSGVVFVLCPTTLIYPVIVGDGTSTSTSLLKALVWVDSNKNCLPSLHASLTLISVWALWQPRRMLQNTLYVLWAVFVIFSIVQLRRHLSLDVGAGLLVGFMAIILLNLTVFKAKISHKN